MPPFVGEGSSAASLGVNEFRRIAAAALAAIPAGARVLAIVSDRTRDDNTDLLFPVVSQELARRGAKQLDALVAQGTHPPMRDEHKREKIGAGLAEIPLLGQIFDHHWDRPGELTTIGTLAGSDVRALTGGLIDEPVPVTVNARLAPGVYDAVLVIGATLPHEVAGFAGGAKYFFPGVAGPELTHRTHWLGALATIEQPIGVSYYEDGKLGSIVETGGELIIYAPHLTQISATHGRLIEKYGYAPLEQVREMVERSDELRANLCIAAHLAHVSFAGHRDALGNIGPRYRITMATGISEEICRKVNLGFLDYRTFDVKTYQSDPDTLIVEDAGRDLYLVEPN